MVQCSIKNVVCFKIVTDFEDLPWAASPSLRGSGSGREVGGGYGRMGEKNKNFDEVLV